MSAIDYDKLFDNFMTPSSESTNSIKQVYDIIPTLKQEQIKIILFLNYYIARYDLADVKAVIESYLQIQSKNKNLGYFDKQSASQLLKAYTMEELVKGIKPNISHVEEQDRG